MIIYMLSIVSLVCYENLLGFVCFLEQNMNLTKNFQQLRNKANDLLGNFPHLVFDYVDPEPNFDSNRVYGVVAKLFEIKDHKYASALEVAAGNKVSF